MGSHIFRWEPPDLGYLSYFGDLDGQAAAELTEKTTQITRNQPYVFLLVNLSHIGSVSREARRNSATGSNGIAFRGTAIVGASTPIRILATLVARASDLLSHNVQNPTRFFETEAEARAWIDKRRRAICPSIPLTNS